MGLNLTDRELASVYRELQNLGKSKIPAKEKMSSTLELFFISEKGDCWLRTYHNIHELLRNEIINRFLCQKD